MAGNLTKLKEGSYRLRYKDFSKNIKAKSDREAKRKLAQFVTEIDKGDFLKTTKLTFGNTAERWLKDYAEYNLQPKTLHRYKQLLNGRILPHFKDYRLDKIITPDLISFYNSLRQDGARKDRKKGGLAETTIELIHKIISSIFDIAIEWQLYDKPNPCKGKKSIKFDTSSDKVKCYDNNQILALVEALKNEDLECKVVIILTIDLCARIGEVMGIKWKDIDFDNKTISIEKASQYVPGIGTFEKNPKNKTSKRKLVVPDTTIELLRIYRQDQKEKGFLCSDNNNIFLNADGTPKYTYYYSSKFPKILRKHGLEHLNFHGLRHSGASYLLFQGLSVKSVAKRTGHANTSTLLNIYAHAFEDEDKTAVNKLGDIYNSKSDQKSKTCPKSDQKK